MSNRKNGAAAIAASAVALAAPSLALAEENSDLGIGILIPNLSEFIPALIAFLVIWVVLAKFAWPMIVGMLDKRQETIKNNLDEAEAAKIEAQRSLEEYKKQLAKARREAGRYCRPAVFCRGSLCCRCRSFHW